MSDKHSSVLKKQCIGLKMLMKNAEEVEIERVMRELWTELVDEAILGLCFDIHRSVKLKTFFIDDASDDDEKYEIVTEIGLDVFGQVPTKKQFECVCPNCQRNLAASRFAPHLEKCLGMGRNSSRLASRRIANSGGTKDSDNDDDNDNDNDWNYQPDRKAAKRKKDRRNSPRPTKSKHKNGDPSSVGSNSSSDSQGLYTNYETMSTDEKKALLMQMCGVISEHTKKMCTKSQRCPQHSDEQRKNVRSFLLKEQGFPDAQSEDVPIDIDTLDDVENPPSLMLNRLWDCNSNDGSLTGDAASNESSAICSKKKDKSKKSNQSPSCKNKKAKKSNQFSSSQLVAGNGHVGSDNV